MNAVNVKKCLKISEFWESVKSHEEVEMKAPWLITEIEPKIELALNSTDPQKDADWC